MAILLGTGGGAFAAPLSTSFGFGLSYDVASGDFNGDGLADLAVASQSSNEVTILFGLGTGAFTLSASYPGGAVVEQVALGDFNGDGHTDFASIAQVGGLGIRLGSAAGTFGAQLSVPTGMPGSNPYRVVGADFNGDGLDDIAVGDIGGVPSWLVPGAASGIFSATTRFGKPGSLWLAAGDLDGDDRIDLVSAHSSSVMVLRNGGCPAVVASVQPLSGPTTGGTVVTLKGTNFAPGATTVMFGSVPGTGVNCPSTTQCTVVSPAGSGTVSVRVLTPGAASADTLHDDFTYTAPPATSCATFSAPTSSSIAGANAPIAVAVGEFNGDAYKDLAVVNRTSNNVSVLLGDGSGGFAVSATLSISPLPSSVAITDFDGDGNSDLVVGFANGVRIFPGAGNGTFASPPALFPGGNSASMVAVGDFNADGASDVAVANRSSNNIGILLGNGDGSFATATTFATAANPQYVVTADFNGDGKLDLAVTNQSSNNISILLGNGFGAFSAPTLVPGGAAPNFLAVGDFDGDGDSDLAASQSSTNLAILLGTGSGTFDAPVNYNVGLGTSTVVVGDLNGDGVSDVATTSLTDFAFLLGVGNGTFNAVTTASAGAFHNTLALGDFNGDSKSDVVLVTSPNVMDVLLSTTSTGTFALSTASHAPGEAVGSIMVTVNRTGGTDCSVTVNYATANGSAIAGADYTATSGVLTFGAGVTSQSFTIPISDDSLYELSETFTVSLTSIAGAVLVAPTNATVTIGDNDPIPSVVLGLTGDPMAEAAGAASVTATLSAPAGVDVTVDLAFNGTATLTSDYTRSGTSIFIPALSIGGSILLTAVQDVLEEPDETVIVDISNVTNASEAMPQQVTATIADDDTPPSVTLSVSGSPIAEAAGVATVTATLSEVSAFDVTVDLAFSGTATLTSDYTRSGTSIVIPALSSSGSITLTAVQDVLDELDETVIVDISNVTNANEVTPQQVTATISDDDDAPSVTLSLTGSPIAESAGVGTVTATLSAVSELDVTIDLSFSGTAALMLDYTRSGTSILIPAGSTTNTITLTAVQDLIDELSETVIVDVDSVTNGTEATAQQVTATITDDDNAPTVTLSLTGSPMAEAGGVAIVTATLSAPSGLDVTVDLAFSGTATLTSDYTRSAMSILIPAAGTIGTITLTAVQDALDELNQTVTVDINSVTNGTETTAQQVTATITDDDVAPAVTLSLSSSPMAEAAGASTVTATLSAVSELDVTIDLAFSGTAALTADYTRSGTSIFIAGGASTGSITLTAVQDAIDELDETVIVDISNVTNGSEATLQQVTATIADDDATPSVTLSLTGTPMAEAAGAANVTATLSAPSGLDVTVNLAFTGTATSPADYTRSGVAIFIPAGSASGAITLNAVQDAIDEVDETAIADISSVTNTTEATPQQVTAAITDDDAPPTLSIDSVTQAEGNGGTSNLTFTVTMIGATSHPVTVAYATTNGTATAGSDYAAPAPSTLVFPPGTMTQTIVVVVNGDVTTEADETFTVTLSNPANASIASSIGLGTIQNDEGLPTLAVDDVTQAEGNSGTTNFTFTVTLTGATSETVTASYVTANGTATAGSDYTALNDTLTFTPSTTTQTITVPVSGDLSNELDETFTVTLVSSSNAAITTPTGTATLQNDDALPLISIGDVSVTEGNAGTANAVFTVTLSTPSLTTVSVDHATADGTATAGSDYAAGSSTLIFAPGVMARTVSIAVSGDGAVEPNETFAIDLTNAANAAIADSQAIGTIDNDDVAPVVPSISISDTGVVEGNSGATNTAFVVTLSAPTTVTVSVAYSTAPGTATAGDDYLPASGTLVFAAGATSQTILVAVTGDTVVEPDETFTVALSSPSNATLGAAVANGTILNDDSVVTPPVVPLVSISDSGVPEGDAGVTNAVFVVALSVPGTVPVTVAYTTADGTAAALSDYAAASGVLVFPPGATSQIINVAVSGDGLVEPNETFTVALSSPSNATLAGALATGTILNDDSVVTPPVVPSVSISDSGVPEGDAGTTTAAFVVTLSAPTTVTVTIAYATANGTASAGSDYAAANGTLVFPPGVTSQPIHVAVAGDTDEESNESFTVQLSNPVNATVADGQATGTIANDDSDSPIPPIVPSITIADFTITEGNAGTTSASFVVTLSTATSVTVRADYTTADGTASAGSDYQPINGTLVFAAGATSRSVIVAIDGDTDVEPNETLRLLLSNPQQATLSRSEALGTILNDDTGSGIPSVSIADTSVDEGDGDTAAAVFTVVLSAPSTLPVTIDYETADGSAIAGADYAETHGSVVFPPGQTAREITVPILGDNTVEPEETFELILIHADGAGIADDRATGTILDDDGQTVTAILVITGSGPGANGSFFRTMLQLHNPTDHALAGIFVFHPMGGGEDRRSAYALNEHETRTMGEELNFSGFGSIDVAPLFGDLPEMSMRIFNDAGSNGTSGFTTTLVRVSEAIRAGQRAILIAPYDVVAARYNIGIRALVSGATVQFALRRSTGAIATTVSRAFDANSMMQIPAAALFGVPLENDDTIEIVVTDGSAIVYGSAVDNVSQDPSFALARVVH
ncbi:MAG TPA: Calx-beta domain-containing protein [Thermoanaerobaculia bacterium]|nr:Calx-beta domain-containing protein [Thermoanaerobaculia bacterium]